MNACARLYESNVPIELWFKVLKKDFEICCEELGFGAQLAHRCLVKHLISVSEWLEVWNEQVALNTVV